MAWAKSVCPVFGCAEITDGGRCAKCKGEADRVRGTAAQRGYSGKAWRFARLVVLRRDPVCVMCKKAFSTVADHYPISRRDLVAMGIRNPDAPERLRALCASCHSSETAEHQPGGWNRRD